MSSSESSSSTPSLPVIIVCSAVGGIIFVFVLVRVGLCIHRRRVLKPLPLPPARPLTMQRDSSWNPALPHSQSNLNFFMPSLSVYHASDPPMSQRNLLVKSVSRQYSLSTEETSPLQPPSPHDAQLVPPQPFFLASSESNSARSSTRISVVSSSEGSDIDSFPPQRHQSMTALPTIPLPDDPSASQPASPYVAPSTTRKLSPSSRSASRRSSVAASVSSLHTSMTSRSMRSTRSLSTIRGAPHRPHSRVEIVLPTPLAPRSQLYMSDNVSEMGGVAGSSSRQSTCDLWIRVGRESTSQPVSRPIHQERMRHSRSVDSEGRRSSAPRPRSSRLSHSSSSGNVTASATMPPSSSSFDAGQPPPVPRVPSMFFNSASRPATLLTSDSGSSALNAAVGLERPLSEKPDRSAPSGSNGGNS
ncbi:hypothetical protein M0805_003406 [Coniferiporia weirii]|nr:hypothetical protein M0805_003406 [Coniferiporia weirii]